MDEQELRRAIIAEPQEDGPRLAYAAWCDAQGDKAHGDYIRAAVARAHVDRHGAEAQQLFQEEMRAVQSRPKESNWRGGFSAVEARYKTKMGITRPIFYYGDIRGFMGILSAPLPDILAVLEELCAVEPIELLGIQWEGGGGERETPEDARKLAEMPLLRRIRSMSMPAQAGLIETLGKSAFVGNVERLLVYRQDWEKGPLDVEALVGRLVEALGQGFAGVKQLEIKGVALGAAGVARLCASAAASRWERLVVERAGLRDAGAQVLAGAPLGNVEELWLRENEITAEGVKAMADAAGLARVRDLDLGKNTIDEAGMRALAQRKSMQGLIRLGVEESVHKTVYVDWTDWTGANIGGGDQIQVMRSKEVAEKYPLLVVSMYEMRHE